MLCRFLWKTRRPIRLTLAQPAGKVGIPLADERLVRLEMKLEAVGGAADAKRLVGDLAAAGQMRGPGRQVERVVMPLEDRKGLRQRAEHGVGLASLGEADLVPAEFRRAADVVLTAKGARHQLATEADAEHGTVATLEVADQVEQGWKIRVLVVVAGVLSAAQHDQRVVICRHGGQRVAKMRMAHIRFDGGLVECGADIAEAGLLEIVDDKNTFGGHDGDFRADLLLLALSIGRRCHEGGSIVPLQNRVDPWGDIHAVAARGLFTGNRGVIHDPANKTLLGRRWTTKAWIICVCEFRGRRREVMGRNAPSGNAGWTELFFLDEVTALAAGHRPCFYCQRQRATEFAAAYGRTAGQASRRAPAIDAQLHAERRAAGAPAVYLSPETLRDLPDGAMIEAGGACFALHEGRLLRWSFTGYANGAVLSTLGDEVRLITPPSTIAALRAGYRPVWA